MISLGRLVVCGLLALRTLLASAPSALAQSASKPAVVVSIAKVDKLLGDIGYLTRAAGTPEFGGLVTLMAGPYLQGIDTKRPAGVYLRFNGPAPSGVAFLPVSDLNQIIKQLEGNSIEVEDAGGGLKKIQVQRAIYFKERSGWIFISDSENNLNDLPADPAVVLGDLPEKYDLGVQLNVRQLDPALIDTAISEMKAGFDRRLEAETDAEKRQLQEKVGRQSLEGIVRLLQESDQLTFGWGVDSQEGKTYLDFAMTAVAGSKLGQQMAGYRNLKSSFAGLQLPDAAATLRFTAPVPKEEFEQARAALQTMREQALKAIDEDNNLPSPEARKTAKQIISSLIDVLIATIESGKVDGGAALLLGPASFELVAGGFVADGKAIQEQLKKLADLAKQSGKNDAKIEDLKFNAAQHQGVDLNTFTVPIPADEEHARKVLGDKLNVVVGTGPKSAYLAFGKSSMAMLKRIIDASATGNQKDVIPLELNISLAPIMEFAASRESDPVIKMLAEAIKKSAGKDHIRLTQKPIDRGVVSRLEVEEGVLQLIGAGAKARAGN